MKLRTLWPSVFLPRMRVWAFERRFPDAPWLTEAAVYFLHSWLRPSDDGVEWGSGRSTIWLAERVGSLLSIEHDVRWSQRVTEILKEKGLQKKVRHFYQPLDDTYEGVVQAVPEKSLDFALVDGRRRLFCARAIIPKIKPGGILILDNAERYVANGIMGSHSTVICQRDQGDPAWNSVLAELATWRAVLTTNGIWDTRIWIRPG